MKNANLKFNFIYYFTAGLIFFTLLTSSTFASKKVTLPSSQIDNTGQIEELKATEPAITELAEPLPRVLAGPSPGPSFSLEDGIPFTPASALKHPIPSIYGPDPFGREPTRLTLEQSISIAVKLATATLKARNEDQAAGIQLLQGYGQFLPSLAVSGNFSFQTGRLFSTAGAPTSITTENFGPSYQV
ncbi:MAG: hypothetical protein ABIQ95_01115, partial [Bdellovibrionia bacterium]